MSITGDAEVKMKYYTWQDVEQAADSIISQMCRDEWCPEIIVGINRGGLPLAVLLSHKLNVDMYSLTVRLRNGNRDTETNCWLSEWAFGYNNPTETGSSPNRWDPKLRKKILIVDDINDLGKTFDWIVDDWQASCFPNEQHAWDAVWGKTTRFAVMTENMSSGFDKVSYCWDEVNKAEDNTWLVWPWETEKKKGYL